MFKKQLYVLSVLCVIISCQVGAQTSTNSPYSSQGIGLWEESATGVYSGMGGARISLVDSVYSNDYNPSSYSYLGKGLPLFSFDVSSRFSSFQSSTNKSTARTVYIKNINIAIPFAKRFGLAFGLRPVLKRGYRFGEGGYVYDDSVHYMYIGTGQVQQTYLAFSAAPLKTKKHFLSLGIEGDFNFGSLTKIRVVEFPLNQTTYFNASDEQSFRVSSFGLRAGLQYRFAISETNAFSVGLVYQPQLNWNSKHSDFLYRYGGVYGVNNVPSKTDTMYYVGNEKGSITIPQRWGVGFTWEFRAREDSTQRSLLRYRLRLTTDVEMMTWSNYALNFASVADTTRLSNGTYFRFGVEYTPHMYFTDSRPNISYMNKVNYRIGFRYAILPTNVNVKAMNNTAVTFGMGFPIPLRNSVSSVNFGVTLGQQGTKGPSSIQEKYIGFQLGLILSPGADRWFRRYKYD